ncbi:MAG: PaaI family thioesterase [Chloroflexi bacterium]|nr:PaaI family thioesterase [Chloroflexota bacterium]
MTSDVVIEAGRVEVAPHACFACGELNAHGLHLELHVSGDACWTELALRPDFQGWEGIAHGGIIATILDEVMAWALAGSDAWGYTAKMSIEYRRPVRVGARIRGEGQVLEKRRRLLRTSGRLVDPATGEVFATAEGLYVAAPAERRDELKARYGFRLTPAAGDPAAPPAPGAMAAAGDPARGAPEPAAGALDPAPGAAAPAPGSGTPS